MPMYPDVRIADALGCTADDLEFEECAYFPERGCCTVYLGSATYDCFFKDNALSLILDANTSAIVWKS